MPAHTSGTNVPYQHSPTLGCWYAASAVRVAAASHRSSRRGTMDCGGGGVNHGWRCVVSRGLSPAWMRVPQLHSHEDVVQQHWFIACPVPSPTQRLGTPRVENEVTRKITRFAVGPSLID